MQRSRHPRAAHGLLGRPAFTLIDVVVTMAVIAVLVSLLTPSLTTVRESARQVMCRSNVRQLGIGIQLYADDQKDAMPRCDNADVGGNVSIPNPWDTLELRIAPDQWDGLGLLYSGAYLPAPKIFYCPSHKGSNPYVAFVDRWAGFLDGSIVGNFQYRAAAPIGLTRAGAPPPPDTTLLARVSPRVAIAADGMRTQNDYNHGIGANVLRASLAVDWWKDTDRSLFSSLPKDGDPPATVTEARRVWDLLDPNQPL